MILPAEWDFLPAKTHENILVTYDLTGKWQVVGKKSRVEIFNRELIPNPNEEAGIKISSLGPRYAAGSLRNFIPASSFGFSITLKKSEDRETKEFGLAPFYTASGLLGMSLQRAFRSY